MFKNGPSIDREKILFALAVYALGVVCFFVLFYLKARELTISSIDDEIKTGAYAAKHLLGDAYFERATEPGAVSEAENLQNTLKLSKFANDLQLKYIYAAVKYGRNFCFSCSSATEKEFRENDISKYFDPYDDAPAELYEAYDSGQPRYAEYKDRWGTFRSAFIPMKTQSGKTYVVCADMDLEKVKDRLRHTLYASLLPPILALMLALPLLWMHFSIERSHKRLLKEKQAQLVHAGRLTAIMGGSF